MTKIKAMRIIRDVMDGTSGHTHGIVYKVGKSWKVETSINRLEGEGARFQHDRNEMTLKDVEEFLSQNWLPIHENYYNGCNCPRDEYLKEYHKN
jgi:hypothetical protein